METTQSPTPNQLFENGHSINNIATELEMEMIDVISELIERDAHLDGDGTEKRIAEGMRALLDEYNLREIGEQVGRSYEWVRQKLVDIGVDVSSHTIYDKSEYSKEECVTAVVRFCDSKGEKEYPYAKDYNDWVGEELPKKHRIMEHFNSWDQVLRAAEMPTKKYRYMTYGQSYSQYEIVEQYHNLWEDNGREPTAQEIQDDPNMCSYQTFINRLNGKSEVNEIIGKEDSNQTAGRNTFREMAYYDNEDIINNMVHVLYHYRQFIEKPEHKINWEIIDQYWDGPRVKYLPHRVYSRKEIREIGFRILDGMIDLDSVDWSQHNAFKQVR